MNRHGLYTGLKLAARLLLGGALGFAGISHLTWSRIDFLAQVPPWVALSPPLVVLLSGIVEIGLGLALLFLHKQRAVVGLLVAAFFVAIFPGNIAQWAYHRNAFNLNSDHARTVRLFWQPVFVIFALWCTDAWVTYRSKRLAG